MEYSSDDIASARSLQFATYIDVSISTIWLYYYACSFHEEWTFLLRSHWSRVKCLYIVTRYLPSILFTANLYLDFTSNDNTNTCRVLGNMGSGVGVASVIFSECLFILRTYVVWTKNRMLLAATLSTFFTFIVASLIIDFTASVLTEYATSAIPGITGCYNSSTSFQLSIQYILLSVFQLGLMMLTLVRATQSWRMNSSRLYVVLVKHNVFYYTCGFLFSLVNAFTSLLLQYAYRTLLYDFQVMILAILATRMHLHLWQMNQHAYRSDALVRIPISEMSAVNSTV
ncbi:hypothetical protein BD769DRAFT_1777197 [Suillus cothurnatus]|nr:hypothetical protein BD769DRAFT_1777197 [Suillus cothurnatus]